MASKMSSLMDLVSQNQPHFKTHQALLVIGMQNDFIQPDGRLPVSTENGYLDRIQTLIPKFRKLNGNVIWVQTLYEEDRIANDANTGEGDAMVVGGLVDGDESSTEGGVEEEPIKDLAPEKAKSKHKQRALDILKRVSARRKTLPREVAKATVEQDDELFLMKSEKKMPACVPDTHGAQFADVIAMQFELPADSVIKTSNYSAFQGTPLLMTLRARLVTELFICGCITNVSVLATVIDAARHGVKINVIEDCLGYRKQSRHEVSLKRMDEFFDAYLVKSTEILAREPAAGEEKHSTSPSSSRKGSKGEKPLEAMVGRLSLNDGEARPSSRPSSIRSPTRVLTGGQRKLSLVSVAESRKALSTPPSIQQAAEPSDKEFADNLVRGAIIPGSEDRAQNGEKEETKLVTKKIRMRSSKARKKKKKTDEESPEKSSEAAAEVTASVKPIEQEKSKTGVNKPNAATDIAAEITEALKSVKLDKSAEQQAIDAPAPQPSTPTKHQPPAPEPEKRRGSLLSRAESVLNLREKMSKQQSLKSVASQPVLSGKVEAKEKEKDRDSWSDRMRMSLSRAPKSDSASESKNRLSYVSTKAPSTPSRAESRPASIAATIAEVPLTPSRIPEPAIEETPQHDATATIASQTPTKTVPDPVAPVARSELKNKKNKLQSLANLPVLGPGDKIGEGDSSIVHDFLPPDLTHPTEPTTPLRDVIFTQLYNEVNWQKMLHQTGEVPRLVCCQGEFGDDGSMPVYRHPSDQTLPLLHFSPKVQLIRKHAEKVVGHPLNHVLIQLYRSGEDFISEHSDKTLDIVRKSSIVNVSFGAQRTMRLRTKRPSKSIEDADIEDKSRTTQRIHFPHNSLFTLGPRTNTFWLHGIQPDKRLPAERSPAEFAFNGMRISLTFRHIGTFLDARARTIWGQGATAKLPRDAADVLNADPHASEALIRAFSLENRSAGEFDWDATYGCGFDVLHLHSSPPDIPILFGTHNAVETLQVRLALWEARIEHTYIEPPALDPAFEIDRKVMLRDTDMYHTQIQLSTSISFYIDKYHPFSPPSDSDKSITSRTCDLVLLAAGILKAYHNVHVPGYAAELEQLMGQLEDSVREGKGPYVAGSKFSVADCFVWPVVDEVCRGWVGWREGEGGFGATGEWYRGVWRKKGCLRRVRETLPDGKNL